MQILFDCFVIGQCQIVPTGMHLKYSKPVFEFSEIVNTDRIDGVWFYGKFIIKCNIIIGLWT